MEGFITRFARWAPPRGGRTARSPGDGRGEIGAVSPLRADGVGCAVKPVRPSAEPRSGCRTGGAAPENAALFAGRRLPASRRFKAFSYPQFRPWKAGLKNKVRRPAAKADARLAGDGRFVGGRAGTRAKAFPTRPAPGKDPCGPGPPPGRIGGRDGPGSGAPGAVRAAVQRRCFLRCPAPGGLSARFAAGPAAASFWPAAPAPQRFLQLLRTTR